MKKIILIHTILLSVIFSSVSFAKLNGWNSTDKGVVYRGCLKGISTTSYNISQKNQRTYCECYTSKLMKNFTFKEARKLNKSNAIKSNNTWKKLIKYCGNLIGH